jgi:hypothetical protein
MRNGMMGLLLQVGAHVSVPAREQAAAPVADIARAERWR